MTKQEIAEKAVALAEAEKMACQSEAEFDRTAELACLVTSKWEPTCLNQEKDEGKYCANCAAFREAERQLCRAQGKSEEAEDEFRNAIQEYRSQ